MVGAIVYIMNMAVNKSPLIGSCDVLTSRFFYYYWVTFPDMVHVLLSCALSSLAF